MNIKPIQSLLWQSFAPNSSGRRRRRRRRRLNVPIQRQQINLEVIPAKSRKRNQSERKKFI